MTTLLRTPGVYVERYDLDRQGLSPRRTDVAGFVGIAERGPLHQAIKIESTHQFETVFGGRLPDAFLREAVAGFFDNGGRTCWIVRVADPSRALAARVRVLAPGRRSFVLQATSPGVWGNSIALTPVWGRDRMTHLVVRTLDHRTQTVDLDLADQDPPVSVPAGGRNLLGVPEYDLPELAPDAIVEVVPDDPWVPTYLPDGRPGTVLLTGGDDGLASLVPEHFTGNTEHGQVWGIEALERVDGVSFVAVPDLMAGGTEVAGSRFEGFSASAIQHAQVEIIASCMRRRDRLAILDLPRRTNQRDAVDYRQALTESSYAAVYHPWVLVDDPLRTRGVVRVVPPSGAVAGVYARSDRLRGVHKPPANEILEGVCDVAEALDDRAHGVLNDSGINAIRSIPGRGIRVLGARTLDPDFLWRYVNVRRLFAMIEETLEEQLQWVTFEPNRPQLRGEIDRTVRGFLEGLFRSGMLDGSRSDEAYFVRCDDSTNPPSEVDAGRVSCVIGIQPPYPAEFVIVRIGITRSGIQVEEKGAQDV